MKRSFVGFLARAFWEEMKEMQFERPAKFIFVWYIILVVAANLLMAALTNDWFDSYLGFRLFTLINAGIFCGVCLASRKPKVEDAGPMALYGLGSIEVIFLAFGKAAVSILFVPLFVVMSFFFILYAIRLAGSFLDMFEGGAAEMGAERHSRESEDAPMQVAF